MKIVPNVAKERMKQGKLAVGLQVRLVTSVAIARLAAAAGYHYLFIDLEHNTFDIGTVSEMCLASLDAGITATVRVPGNDYSMAARLLDNGCQGIVIPHVPNAAAAREAVDHLKYWPLGHRSFAGAPPQLYWQNLSPLECAPLLNENTQLMMTIESVEGLNNIEEIAAVEGVDAIAVGTNDLALDMGIAADFEDPRIHEAHRRILAAGKKNNVPVRIGGSFNPHVLQRVVEMGASMISVSSDLRFLNDVLNARMGELKSLIDPKLFE